MLKTFGYEAILQPLLRDLKLLESKGIFVPKFGASVKGSVLFVSSDNLRAHSLAGFHESFNVQHFCRFCTAKRSDI